MAVIEQIADRVAVMKDGVIVEEGDRARILRTPRVEYTRLLLSAAPCTTWAARP